MTLHYIITIAILALTFTGVFYSIYSLKNKKSKALKEPFTERPRLAGYSLQEKAIDLWMDFTQWFFIIILWSLMPLMGQADTGTAWTLTAISIAGIIYSGIKMKASYESYQNHHLGLKGEQFVGATLDRLSTSEIKIYHDYPVMQKGKKPWNIDHIIVAPTGIFTVETETRRKKHYHDDKNGHKVIYENGILKYPNSEDSHGLNQAKLQAEYLTKTLTSSTGTAVPVTPLLIIPGWFIERKSKTGIFVGNEKNISNLLVGTERIDSKTRQQIIHQLEQVCIV